MIHLALIFGFVALALAIAALLWPRIFPDHSRDEADHLQQVMLAELRDRVVHLEQQEDERWRRFSSRLHVLETDQRIVECVAALEKLPRPAPAEPAHQGYVEIERVNHSGEWEHDHWVRENSDAKQRAWNEPGLRLKYRSGRIDEGNQI